MDNELDTIITAEKPQEPDPYIKQKSIDNFDHDSFIDEDSKEMTSNYVLTELKPMELLRRNSSKKNTHNSSEEKENSIEGCASLSSADTVICREDSDLSKADSDTPLSRDKSFSKSDLDRNPLRRRSLENSLAVLVSIGIADRFGKDMVHEKSDLHEETVPCQQDKNKTKGTDNGESCQSIEHSNTSCQGLPVTNYFSSEKSLCDALSSEVDDVGKGTYSGESDLKELNISSQENNNRTQSTEIASLCNMFHEGVQLDSSTFQEDVQLQNELVSSRVDKHSSLSCSNNALQQNRVSNSYAVSETEKNKLSPLYDEHPQSKNDLVDTCADEGSLTSFNNDDLQEGRQGDLPTVPETEENHTCISFQENPMFQNEKKDFKVVDGQLSMCEGDHLHKNSQFCTSEVQDIKENNRGTSAQVHGQHQNETVNISNNEITLDSCNTNTLQENAQVNTSAFSEAKVDHQASCFQVQTQRQRAKECNSANDNLLESGKDNTPTVAEANENHTQCNNYSVAQDNNEVNVADRLSRKQPSQKLQQTELEKVPEQQVSGKDDQIKNTCVEEEDNSTNNLSILESLTSCPCQVSCSPLKINVQPEAETLSVNHNIPTNKRTRSESPDEFTNPSKLHKSFGQNQNVRSICTCQFCANLPGWTTCTFTDQSELSRIKCTDMKSLSLHEMNKKQNKRLKRTSIITRRSISRAARKPPNHSAAYISQKKGQIFKAVEVGDLDAAREIMFDVGPYIRMGRKDSTLLHVAASTNQSDLVLYLLKFVNPNVINKDGQTPAHLAATKGHTQILKILMADQDFNPYKRDKSGMTFRDLLHDSLFEAVLNGDKMQTRTLIQLGANPDCHAGRKVNGILSKELNVTTASQLAQKLHGENFLQLYVKHSRHSVEDSTNTHSELIFPTVFSGERNSSKVATPSKNMGGYACILNFRTFKGKPELEREKSDADSRKLAKVLEGMGFFGHVHTSLTAEQVKRTLQSDDTRKMLNNAKCAVFVISSHSINKNSFLTSDMKLLTTEWVMNLIKESESPQLKCKPKLFIFDLDYAYNLKKMNLKPEHTFKRMEEPLEGTLCLSSVNIKMNRCNPKSHSFMNILCRTLKENSQLEFADLHRQLVKECRGKHTTSLPELRNYALTDKFYLCSRS